MKDKGDKMFNYQNINDVEFEDLCKDIMEKKLAIKLRGFSKGRDGGIDLVDNPHTKTVVVQVKHYVGSNFSSLRSSLRKEIDKVEILKPKRYYVCCSMFLTASNIQEIYEMFSDFMESDQNIITLKEVDEFLQQEENVSIVRKHYKLWLYASNILSEIYNQNIFIDCESLLSDIEEEAEYFVQTKVYDSCLDYVEKNGLLMITGGPGVGKTITSKMLVLYLASQGYRVRYSTNGDISDIKRSISSEKECKEVILLDDCLGQHYFNMRHTQEEELLALIRYIKLTPNKKLILNSRITIFNEAKDRSLGFNKIFQEKKLMNYVVDMNEITFIEKAKIFYNHIKFKKMEYAYFHQIKENKNYLAIVKHNNYTPRIIEHLTSITNFPEISAKNYIEYVFSNLSNPQDIWKNEFNRRLQNIDRTLLLTLYSLTDTNVKYDSLKKCFNKKLSNMKNIDYTVNNFEGALIRLNQSFINIIIDHSQMRSIGVINPSVNDYLKSIFFDNDIDMNEIRDSICEFRQIERCYPHENLEQIYFEYVSSEKIHEIEFLNENLKNYFILSYLCKYNVRKESYKSIVFNYLQNSYERIFSNTNWLSHEKVLESLLYKENYEFYDLKNFVENELYLNDFLQSLTLDELITAINIFDAFFLEQGVEHFWYNDMCEEIFEDSIKDYVDNLEVSDYFDAEYAERLIQENTEYNTEGEGYFNDSTVIRELEVKILSDIYEEINEKLLLLKNDLKQKLNLKNAYTLDSTALEGALESYMEEGYYEDNERDDIGIGETPDHSIEIIFERDL